MSPNPKGSFEIPQDVLDKLAIVLNGENFTRIGFFLTQCPNPENYIRLLKAVIGNDDSFRSCANRLVDDTNRLKDDPDYLRFMNDIWNNYMKPHLLTDGPNGQEFNYQLILSDQVRLNSIGTYSFLSTLARLPRAARLDAIRTTVAISEVVMPSASALAIRRSAGELMQSCRTTTGKLVTIGLVAVYLAWDVLTSIKKWWNGEISGERCWKNIIDSTAGVAAGVGGSFLGASIGTAILPGVGTVIGGVIGGVGAAELANVISDWCTQKLFNLPKDVALENAYRYLSLSCSASNNEINDSFRRLALQYHPDKGGNYEDWHKLQYSMAVIKASKGEI